MTHINAVCDKLESFRIEKGIWKYTINKLSFIPLEIEKHDKTILKELVNTYAINIWKEIIDYSTAGENI